MNILRIGLSSLAFAFSLANAVDTQTARVDRIQIATSQQNGDVILLRHDAAIGHANCRQNPGYTLWYISIWDGKAKHIHSLILSAMAMKKSVTLQYEETATSTTVSPHGTTSCRIVSAEIEG